MAEEIPANHELVIATLPPGPDDDGRRKFWLEAFGSLRIPVKNDEPAEVIFPNGQGRLCYLLDFSKMPADGKNYQVRLFNYMRGKKVHPAIVSGIMQGIYPVHADGVTVIRARAGFLNWEMQPPAE